MVTWTRIYVVFMISQLINPSVRARKNMLATRSCNQPYQPAADYPQWFLQSHTHMHGSTCICLEKDNDEMPVIAHAAVHFDTNSSIVVLLSCRCSCHTICVEPCLWLSSCHCSKYACIGIWQTSTVMNHDMFICPVRSIEEKLPRATFFDNGSTVHRHTNYKNRDFQQC